MWTSVSPCAQATADAAAGITTAAAAPVIPPPAKRGRVPFHVGTLARPQDSFDVAAGAYTRPPLSST
jgi:hypothetical protein